MLYLIRGGDGRVVWCPAQLLGMPKLPALGANPSPLAASCTGLAGPVEVVVALSLRKSHQHAV
jgi:hypothetical protein